MFQIYVFLVPCVEISWTPQNITIQIAQNKWVKVNECSHVWRNSYDKPPQLSDYRPFSFVGWPQRMWWERATGREIMKRQRVQAWVREDRSERQKERKRRIEWERHEVREPADVKVPPITSCFSSAPSLCLYLFDSFFLSFPLEFFPSTSVRRDVGFWSTITTEMSQSRPTHTQTLDAYTSWKCQCKLKVALKRAQAHTLAWTQLHTGVAFESCSQGIMTAFCSSHSWDSSHRQDRRSKKKGHFFLSSPLILLPTSSSTTLTLFKPRDLPPIYAIGQESLDVWIVYCKTDTLKK